MIPKIIFQTSPYKPQNYQVETIKLMSKDWEYKHFIDSEIIEYITLNPIPEFSNSVEIFNSLKTGAHKADFFRYYFLYLQGGVYIDNDARLEIDIEQIIGNYTFFTVKSAIENCKIFNGFIGCEPGNIIIFESLKWIHLNFNNIKDYFEICRNLNFNYINYKKKNHVLFSEEMIGKIANIKDLSGKHVLTHYFVDKKIEPFIKVDKDLHKIGVTFTLPKRLIELFSSGIQQNVLFFTELLLNIGHDAHLIIRDPEIMECKELEHILYDSRFKYCKYSNILLESFDIVIDFGYTCDPDTFNKLKDSKTKMVGYKCGNEFIINSEDILYGLQRPESHSKDYFNYHKIWSIPQMMNTNKYYWQILHRTECIEAPFIWSDKLINNQDFLYTHRPGNKKIAIMEPNFSLMKSAIPPILICENAYRKNKNIISVHVTNINSGNDLLTIDRLNNFIKKIKLVTDNKIHLEPRYHSLASMRDRQIDIVVSHQWENPLNYLYLDLAWMGWPIVHNGSLCKDIGYYYPEFNYEEGANILSDVIDNHHLNSEEYLHSNRRIINRYLPSNRILQNKYSKMIKDLYSQ